MGHLDHQAHQADRYAPIDEEAAAAIVGYAIGRLLLQQADIEAAAATWGLYSIIHRPRRYLLRREDGLAEPLGAADSVPDMRALAALAWSARRSRWPVHTDGLEGLAIVGASGTVSGPDTRACAVLGPHAHGHVLLDDNGPKWRHVLMPSDDCAVAQGLLEVLAALRAMPGPARQ